MRFESTDYSRRCRSQRGLAPRTLAFLGCLVATLALATTVAGQPVSHEMEEGGVGLRSAQELAQRVHRGLRCLACHGHGPMMWHGRTVDPVATCGQCHQQEWHFYFTMFNPDVFPLSQMMITGRMTREEMEREHPGELEEGGLRNPSAEERLPAEDPLRPGRWHSPLTALQRSRATSLRRPEIQLWT